METLTLARRLELGPLPPAEAVRILSQVAQRVAQWHARGWLHRELSLEAISLGASSDETEVAEPAPLPILFGGPHWDPEKSPAEFSGIGPIFVSRDLAESKTALAGVKLQLDPVQIDVYQLGALFHRVLTGEGVTAYLSSPKTRSRVPEAWRNLLDQALGSSRERIKSAAGFAQALVSSELPTQVAGDTAPAEVPPVSVDQPIPFTRIGDYEIRGRIGHGGMGDVYQAFDERRNRDVAVKVLPAELARQTDFVRRFYAEAAAAARLVHPHIIEILYVGEDQGRHFFVMEYVAGESLGERLARQKFLSVDEAANITLQILSALETAHQEGFVHRDIKPSNILLESAKRRAVLADFGLVKSLQEATGMTATGVVVGTVHYLSPEQARGRSIDGRSDLYSVGVLLYQMLSGELPFTGEGTTALIYQHLYEPPRPLIEVAPQISPVLGTIVDKLLRKSPADRYASAEQLAGDLKAFLTDQPLPSGADIVDDDQDLDDDLADGEPGLDTTAIIAAPKFEYTPQIAIPDPPPEPEATPEPGTWWERIEQRLWKTLREQAPEFAASLQTVEQELDSTIDDLEEREKELQRLAKKALRLLQELRQQRNDWQTAAERAGDNDQQLRAQQHIRELTQQIADQQEQLSAMRLQQAKVSATLERLRSQRDTLQARMKVVEASLKLSGWRRRTRTAISVLFLVGLLAAVTGIWIAWDRPPIWKLAQQSASAAKDIVAPDAVTTLPLAIPENQVELPRQTLKGNLGSADYLVFSPDGSHLYAGGRNGHVVMWDLDSGRVIQDAVFKNGTMAVSISGLALEPQSGRILSLAGGVGENLQIWSPELDDKPAVFELKWIRSVHLAPDLDRALVVRGEAESTDETLEVYNLQKRAVLQTISKDVYTAAFSPATDTAVFTSRSDGVIHIWSLEKNREIKTLQSPAEKSEFESLALSSDGKWAARLRRDRVNAMVELWDLPNARLRIKAMTRDKNPRAVAFQPGTDMLAVATDETVELWDLERERVRKLFQARNIIRIAFSPDGRTLAAGCYGAGTSQDGLIVLWDALPDPVVTTGNPRKLQGTGPADLSRDGEHYISFEEPALVYRRLKDDQEVSRLPVERRPMHVLLSPDNHLVAYDQGVPTDNKRQWTVVALASGQVAYRGEGDSKQFRFAPDSSAAYFHKSEGIIKSVFDSGEETVVVPASAMSGGSLDLAVSSDENYLAISGWSSLESRSYLAIADLKQRGKLRRLPLDDHYVWSTVFSPAGDKLAAGSKSQITIWNAETGQLEREIAVNSGWIQTLTFSSDGRFLASGPKGPKLWSAETGELLIDFAPDGTRAVANEHLAFTPDGSYLLMSGNGERPGQPVMLLDKTAWIVPGKQ